MSKNDVTGDNIKSKLPSKSFDENFDRIFGKPKDPKVPAGYTAEELERDNPFNAWCHEHLRDDLDKPED